MKDYESIHFNNEKELKAALDDMCRKDIWKRCYISELSVSPLPNNPIEYQANPTSFCMELGLDPELDEDTVLSTMEDIKLLLQYPLEKMTVSPIRWTAFKSLCDRAGLSGPSLTTFQDKAKQTAMSEKNKAVTLNYGLECFSKSKALLLIRDEKISAVLSGDESDYSILPQDKLFEIFKNKLDDFFDDIVLRDASIAHDVTSLSYVINDASLISQFENIFKTSKIGKQKIVPSVGFVTSDIGYCGANIIPQLIYGGKKIPIGEGLRLAHKNGKTLDDFNKNCNSIMAMFQDASNMLAELENLHIENPYGCFVALCKRQNLPKLESVQASEEFNLMVAGRNDVTALEIYFAVSEIIDTYVNNQAQKGKEVPLSRLVYWQEQIARILTYNFYEYDHSSSWE